MSQDTPLNVPFKEKDEAKALGARWNPAGKYWYVPAGTDTAAFAKWLDGAPEEVKPVPKPATEALPENANFDDINAMLRDASEDNEDVFFEEE